MILYSDFEKKVVKFLDVLLVYYLCQLYRDFEKVNRNVGPVEISMLLNKRRLKINQVTRYLLSHLYI